MPEIGAAYARSYAIFVLHVSEDPDVTRSLFDSPPTKSAEMAKVRVRMNVPTMTKRDDSWSFLGYVQGRSDVA